MNARKNLQQIKQIVSGQKENAIVISPSNKASTVAAVIKSLSEYNSYNVKAVIIEMVGLEPFEVGLEFIATNLAESFMTAGQLTAGTYIIVTKTGGQNIFQLSV